MSQEAVHPDDRGLGAVARVREVRETDSRIGLQKVLAEENALANKLSALESRIAASTVDHDTTAAALVAERTALANTAILVRETRENAVAAAQVTAAARARWGADHARLAAVELLLAKRATERRTEADRRADREADDMAAQRWARDRGDAR